MASYHDRERFSLADARLIDKGLVGRISHILDNKDGTYSVIGHSVCEHCDYCDESNKMVGVPDSERIHTARPNPYELQGIECNNTSK